MINQYGVQQMPQMQMMPQPQMQPQMQMQPMMQMMPQQPQMQMQPMMQMMPQQPQMQMMPQPQMQMMPQPQMQQYNQSPNLQFTQQAPLTGPAYNSKLTHKGFLGRINLLLDGPPLGYWLNILALIVICCTLLWLIYEYACDVPVLNLLCKFWSFMFNILYYIYEGVSWIFNLF